MVLWYGEDKFTNNTSSYDVTRFLDIELVDWFILFYALLITGPFPGMLGEIKVKSKIIIGSALVTSRLKFM